MQSSSTIFFKSNALEDANIANSLNISSDTNPSRRGNVLERGLITQVWRKKAKGDTEPVKVFTHISHETEKLAVLEKQGQRNS